MKDNLFKSICLTYFIAKMNVKCNSCLYVPSIALDVEAVGMILRALRDGSEVIVKMKASQSSHLGSIPSSWGS